MIIRKALDSDTPQMVEVLKKSMGSFELPVSEKIWNYKHRNNPFGKSFILVAEEGGKIIGVRALMKWQWQIEKQVFITYRAVDTATDPEHQGKGIFRKLTLTAVDALKEDGSHFIFNTPNDKSRPGYIKMGWESTGKLLVSIKPSYSFWSWFKKGENYLTKIDSTEREKEELCEEWNRKLQKLGKIFTPKSSDYLLWRYEKNLLQKYYVVSDTNFYLAAYVKKRKQVKELRVSECIFLDKNTQNYVLNIIREIASKLGVHVISYSPQLLEVKQPKLQGNFGPILTLRDLNLLFPEKFDLLKVESWNYSLGDLELF